LLGRFALEELDRAAAEGEGHLAEDQLVRGWQHVGDTAQLAHDLALVVAVVSRSRDQGPSFPYARGPRRPTLPATLASPKSDSPRRTDQDRPPPPSPSPIPESRGGRGGNHFPPAYLAADVDRPPPALSSSLCDSRHGPLPRRAPRLPSA
jgi:hypothetical protein